jgi:hypothetical protein
VQTPGQWQWASTLEESEEAGGKVRRYLYLSVICVVILCLF